MARGRARAADVAGLGADRRARGLPGWVSQHWNPAAGCSGGVVDSAAPKTRQTRTLLPKAPLATVLSPSPPPRNLPRFRPAPAPIRGSFRAPPRRRSDPRGQFRAVPLLSRCGARGRRIMWRQTVAAQAVVLPEEASGRPISQGWGPIVGPVACLGGFPSPGTPPPAAPCSADGTAPHTLLNISVAVLTV